MLRGRDRSASGTSTLLALLVVAALVRLAAPVWRVPRIEAWTTVFVALCVQATPYVVLGVLVGAALGAMPAGWLSRVLPRRKVFAVPIGAAAGLALPGCDCGGVPVAAGALRRGAAPGPALALMLAGPAANPIVLVATAAAYRGEPRMVLARWAAAMLVALVVGWLWPRAGPPAPVDRGHDGLVTELVRSLGLLAIGAGVAAALTALLPTGWLTGVARPAWLGVLALACLAVLAGSCSVADAFVARSLSQFSSTAQLAFMMVGPAVGARLIALQAGTFGARFTLRFAPAVFTVAVLSSLVVGAVLL